MRDYKGTSENHSKRKKDGVLRIGAMEYVCENVCVSFEHHAFGCVYALLLSFQLNLEDHIPYLKAYCRRCGKNTIVKACCGPQRNNQAKTLDKI